MTNYLYFFSACLLTKTKWWFCHGFQSCTLHFAYLWVFFTLAINQESPRTPPTLCWSLFPSARIPTGSVFAPSQPSQCKHLQWVCCSKDCKLVGVRKSSADVNPYFLLLSLHQGFKCSRDGFLISFLIMCSGFSQFLPASNSFLRSVPFCLEIVPLRSSCYLFVFSPPSWELLSCVLTVELIKLNPWVILISIHPHNLLDSIHPQSYFARFLSSLLQITPRASTWKYTVETNPSLS